MKKLHIYLSYSGLAHDPSEECKPFSLCLRSSYHEFLIFHNDEIVKMFDQRIICKTCLKNYLMNKYNIRKKNNFSNSYNRFYARENIEIIIILNNILKNFKELEMKK
jgi:hypothetical protein